MSFTIKDISKIAGVSTSTVSLVISGKGYISESTHEKVQKVIDDYNYRPLRSARQLPANRTGNIGFIISDVHLSRSEAFYSRILLGAELEARNYDVYLLLSTVPGDKGMPDGFPRFLKGRDVDGVIIAGSVSPALIDHIHKQKLPVTLVDYRKPDLEIDSILMDNRYGISLIVEHLVSQNVTHIGFVGGSFYHPSIKERFEGYQSAMERLGFGDIARDKNYHYLIEEETTTNIGSNGAENLLKTVSNLQAIICVNDTTAIGCMNQLQFLGKKVPDDILVTGFDDVNFAALTTPSLTTVHVPKIEMGMSAMKLLMDKIENPDKISQTQLIPVKLVKRMSSLKTDRC